MCKIIAIGMVLVWVNWSFAFDSLFIIGAQNIDTSKVKEDKVEKDSIFINSFGTRYGFTTNALPIRKKERLMVYNLYGPEFHYGVAKKLSVGVNTSWVAAPVIVTGKYTIHTRYPKINFALNGLIGTSMYLDKLILERAFSGYGVCVYATATVGDKERNISFSSGGFNVGRFNGRNGGAAIFSIAGLKKMKKKSSFLFESILIHNRVDREDIFASHPYGKPIEWSEYGQAIEYEHNYKIIRTFKTFVLASSFGFRFQKTEQRAFQFYLGGMMFLQGLTSVEQNYPFEGYDIIGIPTFMCSWFQSF